MTKIWRNLFILLGVFGFFGLVFAVPASAQYKEQHRLSMDAIKFAENFGDEVGQEYAAIMKQRATDSGHIICGNKDNKCDKATQICIRCKDSERITGWFGAKKNSTQSEEVDDKGRCVSRSYVGNIQAAWPECTTISEKKDRDILWTWGYKYRERHLTWEKYGFLSQGEDFWNVFGLTDLEWSKDEHTFKDPEGRSYMLITSSGYSVAYGDSSDAARGSSFRGCEVFPVKAYNMQGCFYCGIAAIIFDTADRMTEIAFSHFSYSFKVILVLIFAIWLALMSANYAFSMTKQDAPKFLTSVLSLAFKVAIAFYLLSYSSNIFEFFVRPVLHAGIELGEHIQTTNVGGQVKLMEEEFADALAKAPSLGDEPSKYFGEGLRRKIQDYLTLIQSKLAYMQALGSTIFCVGSHRLTFWTILKNTLPGGDGFWQTVIDAFRVMILGGFFTIFGFLLTLAFGYYFVDAIVQLIVIGAMIPFMILTWPLPFGQTKYATKGFEMLINTFFIFFLTGFVVCVDLELVNNSFATAQEIYGNVATSRESAIGFQSIIDALYEQNWNQLNAATTIGTKGFLLLIFSAIFGFQFIGKASEVAGKLSSGVFQGHGGLAGRAGTMAYSTAKGVAGRLASPLAEGVAGSYHEAGGVIGMAAGLASAASKPADRVGSKLSEKLGGAENAGRNWSDKTLRGKVGAVAGGVFKAPGAISRFIRKGAKKIHGTYRRS